MKIKKLEVTFERNATQLYFPQIVTSGIPGNYIYNLICNPSQVGDGFIFSEKDFKELAEDILRAIQDVNKLDKAGPSVADINQALLQNSLTVGVGGVATPQERIVPIGLKCIGVPHPEQVDCSLCKGCGFYRLTDGDRATLGSSGDYPFLDDVCFHMKNSALFDLDLIPSQQRTGKIPAIKRMRELTSLGLREAKDACEAWIAKYMENYRAYYGSHEIGRGPEDNGDDPPL